ncbi:MULTISPECIES: T9SS type A sorting domain-containing protein [Bizionia]|uniref:T9SS type A sorting domain-containing protein n=1 Tax=Bizionia algoritergicola TaxID=291187 RepID=A0A5D0QX87_9FLAO|nr:MULTISPECIES: T9SS type A sorting domain-containing protein [Bizionia]OBX18405.1 hypothetical protein BAA08_15445 [Bizionia sp. APA-3]TYB73489.1 T9SS type A sorting domain-containing protein [Bizionia algoritergicola]
MKQKLLLFTGLLFMSLTVNAQITFVKSTIDASTSAEPYTIASGYLDGDAYLDLAVGSDVTGEVTWYKNNGDGTFAAGIILSAVAPNALSYVEGLTIADINGDGDNDIIAASYVGGNLVWFENNGDDTFEPAVTISSSIAGAGTVIAANIDNDVNGYLDLVVTAYDGHSVVYFLGNGDGTFGTLRYVVPVTPGSSPGTMDIADFDGDGDLDVVVGFTGNGDVKLYDNRFIPDGLDGSGNVPFAAYTNNVDTGNGFLFSVIFADINDDSNLDIVKSDNNPGANPAIAWYSNDASGTGTTFTETTIATSIVKTAAIGVADFNNDSFNDLVVANGRISDNDLIWFTSDATGGLGSEIMIDDSGPTTYDIEIQDFDNDGDLDIASISYWNDTVFIFKNDLFTLSTPEFQVNTFGIYPNPTSNTLNFKTTNQEPFKILAYNILGKEVLNTTVLNNTLDVSILTNGVYLLKVENSDKTFKFVKQ